MSSSISNSKKAALYIALMALLTFGPAMALVNVLTSWSEEAAGDVFGVQRIRSVIDSLDTIAQHQGDSVLFIGSSLVKDGFSPRLFDQIVAGSVDQPVRSFNLGMGNMKPSYQEILALRLADRYQEVGNTATLTLVEFNPFLITKQRENFRPFMAEQVEAVLMSPSDLLTVWQQDPERFTRMMSIKYLRNGVSAEAITGGLRSMLNSVESQQETIASLSDEQLEHLQTLAKLRMDLARRIAAEHPETKKSHVWNPLTGGGLVDMADLSAETQALVIDIGEKMRDPKVLELDLKARISCCDIEELDISEQALNDFIELVTIAGQFSDRVEVVVMPRNRDWVQATPEGTARLMAALEKISASTGVAVRNYLDHPAFDESSFYDVTHLSMDRGRAQFSQLLARDLQPSLGVQVAQRETTTSGR